MTVYRIVKDLESIINTECNQQNINMVCIERPLNDKIKIYASFFFNSEDYK